MCLGVPGKVVKIIDEWRAEVEISGVVIEVGLQFTPDAQVGEYVLVHTGYAMNKLDEEEALDTLQLLKEMTDGSVS